MSAPAASVAEYRDREAWLEARRNFITASDVAAVLGKHPFKSPAEVQRQKLGFASEPEQNAAMRRGILLEPVAVQLYEEVTGRKTRRIPFRTRGVIGATMDRQILAGPEHETGPLEAKVPGYHVFQDVRRKGLPDWWILQGQVEAYVAGYGYSSFAILHADSLRLLHFDVEASDELMEDVVPRVEDWHARHIVQREPVPETTDPGPALEKLPEIAGEIVLREDAEFLEATRELLDARELRDKAKELYDELTGTLKEELGLGCFEGGGTRIYVSESPGRTSTDTKAIAKVKPLDRLLVATWLQENVSAEARQAFGEAADDLALDIDAFRKAGKPFTTLRAYALKEASGEGWL